MGGGMNYGELRVTSLMESIGKSFRGVTERML